MSRRLAACGTAVVAAGTSSGDRTRVIELGAGKDLGAVTGVAP